MKFIPWLSALVWATVFAYFEAWIPAVLILWLAWVINKTPKIDI